MTVMASQTITVACPHCSKSIKGNAAMLGKAVKCPACLVPFDVSAPTPAPAAVNRVQEVHIRIPIIFYIAAFAIILVASLYFFQNLNQHR